MDFLSKAFWDSFQEQPFYGFFIKGILGLI